MFQKLKVALSTHTFSMAMCYVQEPCKLLVKFGVRGISRNTGPVASLGKSETHPVHGNLGGDTILQKKLRT